MPEARIVKLDAKGRCLKSWGHASAPDQMDAPHTLALVSKGYPPAD